MGTPALAGDYGSPKAAADSYRKSLPKLRSSEALSRDILPTAKNNAPSTLNAEPEHAEPKHAKPKQSNKSPVSNSAVKQVEEPTVSDESFFTNVSNYQLSSRLSNERRSPYEVIAAARRADSSSQHSSVLAKFIEQLPKQLNQLHTALRQRPVRSVRATKTALDKT